MLQKMPSFFFRELQLITVFNLQFLYELKHKVRLSKSACGIFHFRFRFVFINVYIFVQQKTWTLCDCNGTRTHNHLVRKRTLNHLVLVYKLSGCGFASRCSNLSFRFRACFEQGVPWYLGNYRVWVHFETRTWHDKNI